MNYLSNKKYCLLENQHFTFIAAPFENKQHSSRIRQRYKEQGVKVTSNVVRSTLPETQLERARDRVVAWKVAEFSTSEVPWSSG